MLALLTVMLTIATPSLRRFYATQRTQDAAAHMLAVCQQARTRAIAEARVYRLHIDVETGRYWLTADDDAGQPQRVATELGRTFTVDRQVTIAWDAPGASGGLAATAFDTEPAVTFYPDGRQEPVQVTFTDTRGTRIAMVCQSPGDMLRLGPPREDFVAPSVEVMHE